MFTGIIHLHEANNKPSSENDYTGKRGEHKTFEKLLHSVIIWNLNFLNPIFDCSSLNYVEQKPKSLKSSSM